MTVDEMQAWRVGDEAKSNRVEPFSESGHAIFIWSFFDSTGQRLARMCPWSQSRSRNGLYPSASAVDRWWMHVGERTMRGVDSSGVERPGLTPAAARKFVPTVLVLLGLPLSALAQTTPAPCRGCFAVVNADGGFNRGKGVTAVSHPAPGLYIITFNKPVNRCPYQATIGRADVQYEPRGFIIVSSGPTTINTVRVATFSTANAVADRAFHFSASCP